MIATMALAFLLQQQEPTHRVHLRNGNTLDGILLHSDGKRALIAFRLAIGVISIRYADVARMPERVKEKCCEGLPAGEFRVHPIRTKTKGEKAILTEIDRPREDKKKDAERDTTLPPKDKTTKTDSEKTTKTDPVDPNGPIEPTTPPSTSAEVRRRIDEHLRKIRSAPTEERDRLALELPTLGVGALEYLADLVDRVDDVSAAAVLSALHGKKDPRAAAILFDKMKSKHPPIRVAVLQVLLSVAEKESTPRFREFLKDADSNARATAITALQKLEDEDSVETIARMTADPDPNVGKTATAAIAMLAPRFQKVDDVVGILKDLLPKAKGKSRAEVVDAIGKMGRKDAADAVLEYLNDPDSDVRASVARACGTLRAEESVDALIVRLSEETVQWVKVQICNAFDTLQSKRAIEALIDLMERDENQDVDEAAARALQHITGKESFGHDHAQWREWWEKVKERRSDNP